MKGVQDAIVELIAGAVGWVVCMAILGGAFSLGVAFAKWNGATELASMFGLLSAASVVWLYERQTAQSRWESLNERLDRLWAKVSGLD